MTGSASGDICRSGGERDHTVESLVGGSYYPILCAYTSLISSPSSVQSLPMTFEHKGESLGTSLGIYTHSKSLLWCDSIYMALDMKTVKHQTWIGNFFTF